MAKELLGTAVTDENGIATFTYTGQGRGKMNIVAESGELVSETFVVTDGIFYDKGLDRSGEHNDNWTVKNISNVSRGSDGTTIDYVVTSQPYGEYLANNDVQIDKPICIEFDLLEVDGYCIGQIKGTTTSSALRYPGKPLDTTGHHKLILESSNLIWTIDGNRFLNTDVSDITKGIFEFVFNRAQGDASVKYKNFVIYPI